MTDLTKTDIGQSHRSREKAQGGEGDCLLEESLRRQSGYIATSEQAGGKGACIDKGEEEIGGGCPEAGDEGKSHCCKI